MSRFRKGTMDHDGDGRIGGSLKGTDMTTKKEEKQAEEAENLVFYEQGRTARRATISREEAPHGEDSTELKHWLKGWDFEDKALKDRPE